MNNLVVTVENVNGVLVTTSNRVAEELGVRHDNLMVKIEEYLSKFNSPELSGQFYIASNYKSLNGRTVKNYLITKKGIAQLIGGYSSAVEKAFDLNVAYINRFEEMEKRLTSKSKTSNDELDINFKALKHIADIMNYNENSKALMINKLIDHLGVGEVLKIDYTKSKGVLKPLTQLLKEKGVQLSTIKINKKLLEIGIIEEKTRNSSKGIKKYKSIKNLDFGENQVSPKNPKETQPLYYENKFEELMELVKC